MQSDKLTSKRNLIMLEDENGTVGQSTERNGWSEYRKLINYVIEKQEKINDKTVESINSLVNKLESLISKIESLGTRVTMLEFKVALIGLAGGAIGGLAVKLLFPTS